jgi:hypothetical protein
MLWSLRKPFAFVTWKERWQIKWDRIILLIEADKDFHPKGRGRFDNIPAIGGWKTTRANNNVIFII